MSKIYDVFAGEFIDREEMNPFAPPERYREIECTEEQQKKGNWHDMRVDPDDMPDVGEKVIIREISGYIFCEYMGKGRFVENRKRGMTTIHNKPIAWMHFEPFEVVADDISEALKPHIVEKGSGKIWVCPRCMAMFAEDNGPENEYCPECGVRFDWSDMK